MKETRLIMSNSSRTPNTRHTPPVAPVPHHDKTQSSHATGVGDHGRWSTQRIAIYALFVALAMATSFMGISIFPAVTYLKYDPSGVVCLIAGFAFGPAAALVVSVLGFVPQLFTDPWGALIAITVSTLLSVPAAAIYKRFRTRKGAVTGILVGALLALAGAIGLNLLITPLYTPGTTIADVVKLIPILLAFNAVKFTINGVVTFAIYKPISNLFNR
jgi:riboflavin transporter